MGFLALQSSQFHPLDEGPLGKEKEYNNRDRKHG
jgi:hypothetical protein